MRLWSRLIGLGVVCASIASCTNLDKGDPEVIIHWTYNNYNANEGLVTIKVIPSLDTASTAEETLVQASVGGSQVAHGKYIKYASSPDDQGQYFPLAREYHFIASGANVNCTITPSASYVDKNLTRFNSIEIDYVITCPTSSLRVSAKNATSPVTVTLSKRQDTYKSVHVVSNQTQANLYSQNGYQAKLSVAPSIDYHVSVEPLIDQRDRVAVFPHQINQAEGELAVNYQKSTHRFIADEDLLSMTQDALHAAFSQGANTLILSGARFQSRQWQLQRRALSVSPQWAKIQNFITNHSDMSLVLDMGDTQHKSGTDLQEMISNLPSGVSTVLLNQERMSDALLSRLSQLQVQNPNITFVINIEGADHQLDQNSVRNINRFLGRSAQLKRRDWVQVSATAYNAAQFSSDVRVVKVMPMKKKHETESDYLSRVGSKKVFGLMLPRSYFSPAGVSYLKQLVFL